MLSGRCPNSAPCTLDPAKKNQRRVQSASNKNTRHSASVHLSQVRYLKIDHLTKSFRPEMCPASCLLWRESNKYTKQKSHNVCTDPHTWIMIWFYPAFWWAARSLNSTDNEQREEDSRGAAGAWNEGTATVTEGMLILPTNTHIHTHTHKENRHMLAVAQTYITNWHKNRHKSWEHLSAFLSVWHAQVRRKKSKQFEVISQTFLDRTQRPYMLAVILPTEASRSPVRRLALSI